MSPSVASTPVTAARVTKSGGPFEIIDATLGPIRDDEVLVRIVAVGMCHTDLVVRDGIIPMPSPIVLGHEGSGIVVATGARVGKVAPGDHVVLTFLSCGSCHCCRGGIPAACVHFGEHNFLGSRPDGSHALYDNAGQSMGDRFFGQSSFASHAIAHERNVIKVRKDAPIELLGPLGCGIQTGAGTVLNALKPSAGSSFGAFGAGAVGLSAVMAARVVGATTIIAVDIVPDRLKLALDIGATHVIDPREQDPVEAIRTITGGGLGFAIDSTALPAVIKQAVAALRHRGCLAIVGSAANGTELVADMNDVMQSGKTIRGVVEGDSQPDIFIPQLINLYMQGRFPFDRLIETFPFAAINAAAAASEEGRSIKPVLLLPG